MPICVKCGKTIDNDSSFCKYCGTKVPVFSIEFLFSLKEWTIDKEDGKPESKHINSWCYYGFEDDIKHDFESRFSLEKRVAVNNPGVRTMGERRSYEQTKGHSFWEMSRPLNCVDENSVIEYFDSYHLFNGRRWHSRHEISVARLNPPIQMKRSDREANHVYVLEDNVVLNDSIDNYQGYQISEEFYSDEKSAMLKLEQIKCSYPPERIRIRDWRKSFWTNYEKYGPNGWYGIDVYDNNMHRIRSVYIAISIIR